MPDNAIPASTLAPERRYAAAQQRLRRFHARLSRPDGAARPLCLQAGQPASLTPLIQRFMSDARGSGTRVVEAEVRPREQAPFGLVLDWLEAVGADPSDVLDTEVRSHRRGARGDRYGQSAFFEAVRAAFTRDGTPLVLVAWVHNALDEDTLALLVHLAKRGAGGKAPTALLFVSSPTWTPDLPDIEVFDVGTGPPANVLEVLDTPELRERLRRFGSEDPAALRALLLALGEDVGPLRRLAWERLDESARRVVAVLALAGRPLEAGELQATLDLSSSELGGLFDSLPPQGVVERVPPRRLGPSLVFPREWIEATLSTEERRSLHLRLGRSLPQLPSNVRDRVQRAEEAARHLQEAARLAARDDELRDEAAQSALDAGTALAGLHAHARARNVVRGALTLSPSMAVANRLEALLAEIEEARGDAEAAIRLRKKLLAANHAPTEQLVSLGALLLQRGDATEAAELLHDGAGELAHDADPATSTRVRARLAEALLAAGEVEEAERTARVAYSEARLARLLDAQTEAGHVLGHAAVLQGNAEEAERVYGELLEVAASHSWHEDAARARHNLGLLALGAGDVRGARDHLEAGLDHLRGRGHALGEGLLLANLAVVAAHEYRIGAALEAMSEAVSHLEAANAPAQLAVALADHAALLLTVGDVRAAAEAVAQASALAERVGNPELIAHCALREGEVLLTDGHGPQADAVLLRAERELSSTDAETDLGWALLARARVAEGRRDTSASMAHLERLERLGSGRAEAYHGVGALVRARLLLAESRTSEALRYLEKAIAVLERHPVPVALAEALVRRAELDVADGDRETAVRRCEDALGLLAEVTDSLPPPHDETFRNQTDVLSVRARTRRVFGRESSEPATEASAEETPTEAPQASAEVSGDGTPMEAWRARFPEIVGDSEATRRVLRMVDRFASVDASILLLGESGTGKELVARALYALSDRRSGPFVRINAAALTESLLLSELFGHERGAFTGAERRSRGAFERADGGVLFLDEIGDISPAAQVALLRVLQEREFLRVGGIRPVHVDVRVICATNRDLERLVADGRFRLDLYHRIRGLTIEIPPLRERPEDIPPLAHRVLEDTATELGHDVGLSRDSLALLAAQPWPGNVRELQNVLRSVAILTDASRLEPKHFIEHAGLVPQAQAPRAPASAQPEASTTLPSLVIDGDTSLAEAKRRLEITCIESALARSGGNITKAADILGMKRPRLSQKIKELGIIVPR